MGVIPLIPFLLLSFAHLISALLFNLPKLGLVERSSKTQPLSMPIDADFETYNYTQTLDHFNYRPESYTTFQQRYVMNSKYWGGAHNNSPIFVYTGDEAGLFNDVYASGIMTDNAEHFKALLLYIEHRYYGESIPFGSKEEAFQNASTLGYFSSAQALADYAEIILHLKKNLSAENSPVIAFGGSYGGMLASWFRLKYPHVVLGAFASSAPILYFEDITPENGYHSVVTKDFREASESCYNTIKDSWVGIDTVASQPDGLKLLDQKFKTCIPLNNSQELKDNLGLIFVGAAQYDNPPEYPVNKTCNAIDGLPQGTDVLSRIFAAVVSRLGEQDCYDMSWPSDSQFKMSPWTWQTCSEMVMPIGFGSNETMFQASPFDLKNYTDDCRNLFGVSPRPLWITTEFGGHDIKTVLQRFASNIIFSNGLRDPYSVGGVLQNISDSVVAIYTTQGSHCLDLLPTFPTDPDWLLWQRNAEIKIIEGWIIDYNMEFMNKTTHLIRH